MEFITQFIKIEFSIKQLLQIFNKTIAIFKIKLENVYFFKKT